ncbi:MAG TPA: response regulator [Candidatus Binataceae bacterium]|nr:response regulator [Candidatus Binataceae bacterium]
MKPIKRVELFNAIVAAMDRTATVENPKLAETPLPSKEVQPRGSVIKILVADDSPDNLALIRAFVAKAPVELDEAANGQIAVDKYVAGRYDLVLMDVQMPVMDGLTAIRTIRSFEAERGMERIPIAALTASVFGDDIKKCVEAGADLHVAKPIKKKRLLELIDQMTGAVRAPSKALPTELGSSVPV